MEAVKIFTSNDGEKRERPKWHLGYFEAATNRTFCEGEAYGEGDSGCEYEVRKLSKGSITCPSCLNKIKEIKAIQL